jgi:DNA-binding transcriptional regulator GbsR (MarR family)
MPDSAAERKLSGKAKQERAAPKLDSIFDPAISENTEITGFESVALTDIPEAEAFILHWGEMGSQWGVNRSVSQIHALLYLSDRPIHAEEISVTLGLARSNVSTALKELQGYRLVRRTHVAGDRRDHFLAETDLWEMLTRIATERKKREVDPTVELLAGLAAGLEGRTDVPAHVRDRIVRMHEFMGTLGRWYDDVQTLPKSTLVTLMKLGSRVARFLPRKDKPGT